MREQRPTTPFPMTATNLGQPSERSCLAPKETYTGIAVESIAAHDEARPVGRAIRERDFDTVLFLFKVHELMTEDYPDVMTFSDLNDSAMEDGAAHADDREAGELGHD